MRLPWRPVGNRILLGEAIASTGNAPQSPLLSELANPVFDDGDTGDPTFRFQFLDHEEATVLRPDGVTDVGGAGLIRVEGAPLGEYYSLNSSTFGPLERVESWGRTQQVTIDNCKFYNCLVGIQFDTFVPKGTIETAVVRNMIHREGGLLASVLDTGNTNGIVLDNLVVWPDLGELKYRQKNREAKDTSYCSVWLWCTNSS